MSITSDFEKLGPIAAFDTETAMAPKAFEGRDCVRLLQAYSTTHEFWYDLAEFSDADWDELKRCLEDPELTLIFQNAAFDIRVLQGCGIDIKGKIEDTMLQSWLLNNGMPTARNSLEAIAYRELGVKLDKSLQKSDWMNAELTEEELAYGMNDVRITWLAFREMDARIREFDLVLPYEIELKAIKPTIEMEATGLYLDRKLMDDLSLDLEETRKTSLAAFVEGLDSELVDHGAAALPKPENGRIQLNKKPTGTDRPGTRVSARVHPGDSTQRK